MEDYYRVRFRRLRPNRRATSRDIVAGHRRPAMPGPLKWVYIASLVLLGVSWIVTVGVGRGGRHPDWLLLFMLPLPIPLLLSLGFSEDQRWTRPLVLLLAFSASMLLGILGLLVACSFALVATSALWIYLYSVPAVTEYYDFLRDTALVRVSLSDLRDPHFVPLYLGAVGLVSGAVAGYRQISVHWKPLAPLGANDAMALVCGALLGAAVCGALGWWIGELCLRRRHAA